MDFLVDAQLPARLAQCLRDAGHDAVHTLDLPDANRTHDAEIIRLADTQSRIVVTKDADFVHQYYLTGQTQHLLLISTGNITNTTLLTLFQSHLHALISALETSTFVELSYTACIIHV